MATRNSRQIKHFTDTALIVNAMKRSPSAVVRMKALKYVKMEVYKMANHVKFCDLIGRMNYNLPERKQCKLCPIHFINV
jgi:hypothetical protein